MHHVSQVISQTDPDSWKINEKDRLSIPSTVNRYFFPRSVQCRNCRVEGHLSRDCPKPLVDIVTNICYVIFLFCNFACSVILPNPSLIWKESNTAYSNIFQRHLQESTFANVHAEKLYIIYFTTLYISKCVVIMYDIPHALLYDVKLMCVFIIYFSN